MATLTDKICKPYQIIALENLLSMIFQSGNFQHDVLSVFFQFPNSPGLQCFLDKQTANLFQEQQIFSCGKTSPLRIFFVALRGFLNLLFFMTSCSFLFSMSSCSFLFSMSSCSFLFSMTSSSYLT